MTSRTEFLLTASIAAAGARELANAGPSPYDLGAVASALARPARHRQVFAVARIADGEPLASIDHALDAYQGEGRGALHAAAVCYGRAALLGLSGAMWRRYGLAEASRRKGDILTAQAPGDNPFAGELAALVARGVSFFVCDRALADWSRFLAGTALDASPAEILAALRAHLIAGALLVPAGVAAINQAQEARFTFFQASI